jgi:hypothetical protein
MQPNLVHWCDIRLHLWDNSPKNSPIASMNLHNFMMHVMMFSLSPPKRGEGLRVRGSIISIRFYVPRVRGVSSAVKK